MGGCSRAAHLHGVLGLMALALLGAGSCRAAEADGEEGTIVLTQPADGLSVGIELKVEHPAQEDFAAKISLRDKLDVGYRPQDVSYFAYVPEAYAAMETRSYPLILAINSGDWGEALFEPWSKAARKHQVFFVCPNGAGNDTSLARRGQMVCDVLADVRARYRIDPAAIYVTGFSGGGRFSTAMVQAFPHLFAGHIPMGGVVFTSLPDLANLKTRLGHYLFAGERCGNCPESRKALKVLRDAKLPCELMVARRVGHDPADADQALAIYEWFLARQAESLPKPSDR